MIKNVKVNWKIILCWVFGHRFESDDGPYSGTCPHCGEQHRFIHDGSHRIKAGRLFTLG